MNLNLEEGSEFLKTFEATSKREVDLNLLSESNGGQLGLEVVSSLSDG